MKNALRIFMMVILLFSVYGLIADAAIPGVVNLEIKDEAGAAITSSTNLSCEVWLNTGYLSKVTFSNNNVAFTTLGSVGIIAIDAKALYSGSGPGDILNVWVQYGSGAPYQEGLIPIPLTDANTQAVVGPDALILTSQVATNTFAVDDLVKTYNFVPPARASGTGIACAVTLTLSADSDGDVTVGLLNNKPGSVPSQGINFGLYFDTKALTTEGSGDHTINIAWSNAITDLDISSGVYGLYLSEDGIYWVNTYNVTYPGKSAYGTTDPSFTVNVSSGSVSFDIDHIPHAIVFGNGATGTTSYTETTPPKSVGLTAAFSTNDLVLTWSKSPQPGVTYDLQSYNGSWSDMSVSGSITGTDTKSYTITSATGSDSKFYRTKVSNNSEGYSYSYPMGYVKYELNATGLNMVGYTMGTEGKSYNTFTTEVTNVTAIKVWNNTTQSWDTASASSNFNKGDALLIDVSAATTWYSVGAAYTADGPYSYTLNYPTGTSGYNAIILPFDEASGISTVAGLYTDIFSGMRGTESYPRTISWYDRATGKYLTYDGGPLSSTFDAQVKVGAAFMIHVGSSDSGSTWPQ